MSIRYRFISLEFVEPAVRANDSYTVTLRNLRTQQVATDTSGVLRATSPRRGDAEWRDAMAIADGAGNSWRSDHDYRDGRERHGQRPRVDPATGSRRPAAGVRPGRDAQRHALPANQIQEMRYVSATPHPAYGGYTRIHGTMTIQGPVGDALTDLRLEFNPRTNIRISSSPPRSWRRSRPTDAAALRRQRPNRANGESTALPGLLRGSSCWASTERRFAVWVTGRTQSNRPIEPRRTAIDLRPLVYYQGANVDPTMILAIVFYPPGWVNNLGPAFAPPHPCGGGAWTRSHVPAWAAFVDATLGDFSNMNALRFPIHGGHQGGLNTDGVFPGVTNRASAATAQRLIDILRLNYVGIQRILITHTRNPAAPNDFYRTLLRRAEPSGWAPRPGRDHQLAVTHGSYFHINWRDWTMRAALVVLAFAIAVGQPPEYRRSGFPPVDAARKDNDLAAFREHVRAIAKRRSIADLVTVTSKTVEVQGEPLASRLRRDFLEIGARALGAIARRAALGWRAHGHTRGGRRPRGILRARYVSAAFPGTLPPWIGGESLRWVVTAPNAPVHEKPNVTSTVIGRVGPAIVEDF